MCVAGWEMLGSLRFTLPTIILSECFGECLLCKISNNAKTLVDFVQFLAFGIIRFETLLVIELK